MTIRKLTVEDMPDALRLDAFAFQFEFAPGDFDRDVREANPDQWYGHFVDGQLAAKVGVLDLQTYVHGQPVPMSGVCGVASWPEHRRGGMVAGLLKYALTDMRTKGQLLSYLAPFSFAFYRRYGWEHCIDRKQYVIQQADWPIYDPTGGTMTRTTDYLSLAPIYERYAARFTGTLSRSSEWWEKRIRRRKTGNVAVYSNRDGVATGYLIYDARNRELTVHEWVALDDDARRGLWRFIGNHDSMASKLSMTVPVDDALPFMLGNPRIGQDIDSYFMCRIVDVEPFLAQYAFEAPGVHTTVAVTVRDDSAPWNTATFVVELLPEGGKPIRVMKQAEATNAVSVDIQTLTAALLGYRRLSWLAGVGRVAGSDASIRQWEQLIPRQTTFLYDFF